MTILVRNVVGYQLSNDYGLLWKLSQKQSIICVINDDGRLDAVHTLFIPESGTLQIGARGICYVLANSIEELVQGWGGSPQIISPNLTPLKLLRRTFTDA